MAFDGSVVTFGKNYKKLIINDRFHVFTERIKCSTQASKCRPV